MSISKSSRSVPPELISTTDVAELRKAAISQYDANSQLRKALVDAQQELKKTNLKVIKAGTTPHDLHTTPFPASADQRQVNELLVSQRERLEQKERELRALRLKLHEKNVGPMPYKGRPGDKPVKRSPIKRKIKPANNQAGDLSMGASTINSAGKDDEHIDDFHDDDLQEHSNEHQSMGDQHGDDDDIDHLDELSSTLAQRLSNIQYDDQSNGHSRNQSNNHSINQSPHESPRYPESLYNQQPNQDQYIQMKSSNHQQQYMPAQTTIQSHYDPVSSPPPNPDLIVLQNQLQTTQVRLATLAGHFDSLQSSFSSKVDLLSSTMNELNDARADNERLNQLVRKYETDRSSQYSQSRASDALRLQVDSLTGENAALAERIQSLTRSLYEADTLEHQRQALLIHSHLNQSSAYDSKLQELAGVSKSLGIENAALQKRLDAKRGELDRQSAQLGLVTADHSTLSQAHLSLSQEHQALHSETRQWREKALIEQRAAGDLRCQVDDLQLRLKREEARSTQLRHELQTALCKPQQAVLPQYPAPVVPVNQSVNQSATRKLDPFDVDRAFSSTDQTAISVLVQAAALTPARFDVNSSTLISAEWPGLSQQVSYSDVQQGSSPVYNLPLDFVMDVSDQTLSLMRSKPLLVKLYDASSIPHIAIGETQLSVARLLDGSGAMLCDDEIAVKSRAGQHLANITYTARTPRPIIQMPATNKVSETPRMPDNVPIVTQDNSINQTQYANVAASKQRHSAAPQRLARAPPPLNQPVIQAVNRSINEPINDTKPVNKHSHQPSLDLNMGADTPHETPRKLASINSTPRQVIHHQSARSTPRYEVQSGRHSEDDDEDNNDDDELFAEHEAAAQQQSAPTHKKPSINQSITDGPQMQVRVTVHACSVLPTNKVRLSALSVPYGVNSALEADSHKPNTFSITFPISAEALEARPDLELQLFSSEHMKTSMADLSIDVTPDAPSSVPRWYALSHGPTQSTIGSIQLSYVCDVTEDM